MNFVEALDVRMEEIASACTRCRKYFQACPITEPAGIKEEEPTKVLSGIMDILRGDVRSVEAEAWASACLSSGFCIEACDYRVNPRMMVRLAHLAMTRWRDGEAVKSNAMRSFRAMAKAVRIILRLQPETDALNELQPPPGPERSESGPDIANYTGCNVRKTPRILILRPDVFRAMGMTLGLLRVFQFHPVTRTSPVVVGSAH
jgi:L-lactate utilization protein LutB